MKRFFLVFLSMLAFSLLTPTYAQNDVMARIEFESAEEFFLQANYGEALKKIEKAESLIAKWTPKVSFLKIQILRNLADFEDIYNPESLSLLKETTAYFDFYRKYPDDIVMDKYKIIYQIDEELIFIKTVKPFKDKEEFIAGDKAYKEGDFEEAIKWFKAGVEKGNPACMNYLGVVYQYGKGVFVDNNEAINWYVKSADKNYPFAMANLGRLYLAGAEPDYGAAMQWFLKAADFKVPWAMYYVGWMYYIGGGVDQNYDLAKEWCQKAAEKGDQNAMYVIGYLYFKGQGVEKNFTKAFEFFLTSAQKGNADGMTMVAYMYGNGNGVGKNHAKAIEWYQKAAEKGKGLAMFNLGTYYNNGSGVE